MIFLPFTGVDTEYNSYLSIADANSILEHQNKTDFWKSLTDDQKEVLLVRSSMLVDNSLQYKGEKTSEMQSMKFPRFGSDKIPLGVKLAVCEIAKNFDTFLSEGAEIVRAEEISKLRYEYVVETSPETLDRVRSLITAFVSQYQMRTKKVEYI